MRKQVELHKKMVGQPFKEVPDEIIMLEDEVAKKKGEIERLKAALTPQTALSVRIAELAVLEARYRQAMIDYEKASSK